MTYFIIIYFKFKQMHKSLWNKTLKLRNQNIICKLHKLITDTEQTKKHLFIYFIFRENLCSDIHSHFYHFHHPRLGQTS